MALTGASTSHQDHRLLSPGIRHRRYDSWESIVLLYHWTWARAAQCCSHGHKLWLSTNKNISFHSSGHNITTKYSNDFHIRVRTVNLIGFIGFQWETESWSMRKIIWNSRKISIFWASLSSTFQPLIGYNKELCWLLGEGQKYNWAEQRKEILIYTDIYGVL